MLKRITVTYRGNVQGVGFRYSACIIARAYPLGGFVKNLPDGSVQLVAQGEEDDVHDFLREVRQRMGRFIRDEDFYGEDPEKEFTEFQIRF